MRRVFWLCRIGVLGLAYQVLPLHATLSPQPPAEAPRAVEAPDPRQLRWVLPVHSSALSPGGVSPRTVNLPGLAPLFLVGEDALSLEWLAQHASTLQALGATGLAVEVSDSNALQRIQAAAPGVPIWPVSGDDLAARLQVEHYPVLITPTSLEQ